MLLTLPLFQLQKDLVLLILPCLLSALGPKLVSQQPSPIEVTSGFATIPTFSILKQSLQLGSLESFWKLLWPYACCRDFWVKGFPVATGLMHVVIATTLT